MRQELGKIRTAQFGFGGYQDAMLGFTFDIGGEGWGIGDFWGTWAMRPEGAEWSLEKQQAHFANAVIRVRDLLKDAGKDSLEDLVGVPVMVMLDGNALSSWRILKEVI